MDSIKRRTQSLSFNQYKSIGIDVIADFMTIQKSSLNKHGTRINLVYLAIIESIKQSTHTSQFSIDKISGRNKKLTKPETRLFSIIFSSRSVCVFFPSSICILTTGRLFFKKILDLVILILLKIFCLLSQRYAECKRKFEWNRQQ